MPTPRRGWPAGCVAGSGHLRDVLEAGGDLRIERATWQPLDGRTSGPVGEVSMAVDDILVAIADDDPTIPVHASWHRIRTGGRAVRR